MTYPFVVGPVAGDEAELPAMFEVRQHFDVLPAVDVLAALEAEWPRAKAALAALAPGASIAVAVGSRGIADIAALVRGLVARLTAAGFEPFIVPAMGSHGGATAAGQTEVLAHLGVTEAAVGAPVRATMEVVSLGEIEGIPLFLDRFAWEADGIVLVNRVKPHTDFVGHIESGLMKQLIDRPRQAGRRRALPPARRGARDGRDRARRGARRCWTGPTSCSASRSSRTRSTARRWCASCRRRSSRRPRASSSSWPGGTSPACPSTTSTC